MSHMNSLATGTFLYSQGKAEWLNCVCITTYHDVTNQKVLFLFCALARSVPLHTLYRLCMYPCVILPFGWAPSLYMHGICHLNESVKETHLHCWWRALWNVLFSCTCMCAGTVRESSQHARACHCVRRSQCQLSAGPCLSVWMRKCVCVWACVVCVCVCIPLNICLHCNSVSVCMHASVYFNTQGIPSFPVMASLPSLITLMNVRPCPEQFSPWVNNAQWFTNKVSLYVNDKPLMWLWL